jgi:hypothetical protein
MADFVEVGSQGEPGGMSLTVLVVMVVVGIAAIVIAVHLTGGTVTARLDSADAAWRRFADDFDVGIRDVWLTEERHAAFLALEDGRAGIVSALGDRFLTRIVLPGDPAMQVDLDGRTVKLRIDDFTWHGGPFTFASEQQAEAVAGLLGASPALAEGVKVDG